MILKNYEIKKKLSFTENNFYLLYGENLGLKKDIKKFIIKKLKQSFNGAEISNLYESEIIEDEENFYNLIYSGSLFSQKKIIVVHEASDKIINKVNEIFEKYPIDVFFIFFSNALEKKSKLRIFFEKNENLVCVPCYLDNERDLEIIAQLEFKKDNIPISREIINLLIQKSNSDRNNLRNEIEKIKSYSLNKNNIELEEVKLLINFSGDYKSDVLINECLCGNTPQYKKIISELYESTLNQVLLLRILSNKIHRLIKIKEQENNTMDLDSLINTSKPTIFWKEKPLVKKQLSIWKFDDLKEIINAINETELLCKKNPQISNSIFFNFFSGICLKASNSS